MYLIGIGVPAQLKAELEFHSNGTGDKGTLESVQHDLITDEGEKSGDITLQRTPVVDRQRKRCRVWGGGEGETRTRKGKSI